MVESICGLYFRLTSHTVLTRNSYDHSLMYSFVPDIFIDHEHRRIMIGIYSTPNIYSRNGAESIFDMTFWSPDLNNPNSDWMTGDGYTHSDHLAIRYKQCKTWGKMDIAESHRRWLTWTSYFDKPAFGSDCS